MDKADANGNIGQSPDLRRGSITARRRTNSMSRTSIARKILEDPEKEPSQEETLSFPQMAKSYIGSSNALKKTFLVRKAVHTGGIGPFELNYVHS